MPKEKILVVDDTQWLGNEASLASYIALLQKDEERLHAGVEIKAYGGRVGTEYARELPYLYTKAGSVGIVAIKGPTTNRTSPWDEYDKRATYPAIREALMEAATDQEVTSILLDIDSPGGAVAGIADVGSLIRTINNNVKPVTAFTDGNMMSAAYWLGSAAGKVYASKVAGVGSIGVIATHMEMSKMMEEMGIKVTVMRAGKYKALANSAEPLTEAAKEQMQTGLDATYGVFVQHVADMRGTTFNKADTTMAQGKEFYGEAALSAGLVDGIESFDSVMSKLSVDKRQGSSHNSQNILTGNAMSKQALTEQSIAAIAAGASLVSASSAPEAPATTSATDAPSGEAAPAATTTDPANPDTANAVEGQAASAPSGTTPSAATPATPATTPEAAAAQASVVSFLQAQVKEKDTLLLQQGIDLKATKDKLVDIEASTGGLLEIAIKSTNIMRVALGGSAIEMKGMSATAILADHAALTEQFNKKFVAGGVAAVDAAQAKKDVKAPAPNGLEAARLKAANPHSR